MITQTCWRTWFWLQWVPDKLDSKKKNYRDKNHAIHYHYIWYIIDNNIKTADQSNWDLFMEKYNDNQIAPDNLPREEFVKLIFCIWRNDPVLKSMLNDLGLIGRFIKICKEFGYNKKWPISM